MTFDKETVKRVAREVYKRVNEGFEVHPWSELPDRDRVRYLNIATAAIAAAWEWKPIEGSVDTSKAPWDGKDYMVCFLPHKTAVVVRASYADKFNLPTESDNGDEDEDGGLWCPEGWYEVCFSHDDYLAFRMSSDPTHYAPIPAAPEVKP